MSYQVYKVHNKLKTKVSHFCPKWPMAPELDVLIGISQACFAIFAKNSPILNHGCSYVIMPEWQCFSLAFITIVTNNYPHEDPLDFGENFTPLQ